MGHSFVRSLKDHLSVPHSKTEFSEDFKISHHCYLHLHGISGERISDNIFVKEILDFAQQQATPINENPLNNHNNTQQAPISENPQNEQAPPITKNPTSIQTVPQQLCSENIDNLTGNLNIADSAHHLNTSVPTIPASLDTNTLVTAINSLAQQQKVMAEQMSTFLSSIQLLANSVSTPPTVTASPANQISGTTNNSASRCTVSTGPTVKYLIRLPFRPMALFRSSHLVIRP